MRRAVADGFEPRTRMAVAGEESEGYLYSAARSCSSLRDASSYLEAQSALSSAVAMLCQLGVVVVKSLEFAAPKSRP